jgi:hypothetical protein
MIELSDEIKKLMDGSGIDFTGVVLGKSQIYPPVMERQTFEIKATFPGPIEWKSRTWKKPDYFIKLTRLIYLDGFNLTQAAVNHYGRNGMGIVFKVTRQTGKPPLPIAPVVESKPKPVEKVEEPVEGEPKPEKKNRWKPHREEEQKEVIENKEETNTEVTNGFDN